MPVPAAVAYQPVAVPQPGAAKAPPSKSGGALKIVLIVVGVFVILGCIAGGMMVYGLFKAKKSFEGAAGSSGSSSSIGVTSGSSDKVAASLGVDVYPGAREIQGTGSTVNFGGISVGGAEFETSDPVSQVARFYRSRYPKSTFSAEDDRSQTLMVGTPEGIVTIVVEDKGEGRTKISLSRMGGNTR